MGLKLDPTRARFPKRLQLYCADCKRCHGEARNGTLGVRFQCCEEKPGEKEHFARVIWDDPNAKFWLGIEKLLFKYPKLGPKFFLDAEVFVAVWLVILLLSICSDYLLLQFLPIPWKHLLQWLLLLLVLLRLADIFIRHIAIAFVAQFPTNVLRSVGLSLFSYIQIPLGFAYWYLFLGIDHFSCGKTCMKVLPTEAIFYSFSTIATVGSDALKPRTFLAQLSVMLELFCGLVFIAIILSSFVGWISKSRHEEGEYPISELRKNDFLALGE